MKNILIVFSFFSAFLWVSGDNIVLADTFTIIPIEASYVDSKTPDLNLYGNGLGVLKFNYLVPIGVLREKISYIKYDLSAIDDAEKIDTIFYNASWQTASQCFSPNYIDIYHVADDNWDAENLTWNNQPGYDDYLGTLLIDTHNPSAPFWKQWDISLYDYSKDLADNTLSIVMVKRDPNSCGLLFRRRAFLEINTQPTSEPATVDIHPDILNKKSKGKYITCYIELSSAYSVENIDIETVMLSVNGSFIPSELFPTEIGDYNNNGIPDFMVKFDRLLVQDACGTGIVEMILTCQTYDGANFEGSDTVFVIDKDQ